MTARTLELPVDGWMFFEGEWHRLHIVRDADGLRVWLDGVAL